METCYAERSKGCRNALPRIPIRKLPHQIDAGALRVTRSHSVTSKRKKNTESEGAPGIQPACARRIAANMAGARRCSQGERPYPPEPLALPANLITGTPEQCAALPDSQQPESTECVGKRGKEYAERLAQWLQERPNGDFPDTLKP